MNDVPAAQTLRRGLSILKMLARSGTQGLRISEIGRRLSLPKATAVRLTLALAGEGFVVQEPESLRYRLGPEAFAVGLAAEPEYALQRLAAPAICALAASSGDSTCFSVRLGDDAVCLSVSRGDSELPPSILRAGDRYPLGISSAGLAILAALPDDEVSEVLQRNAFALDRDYPQSMACVIHQQVEEARRVGYAVIPGLLLDGYWAMGVALMDKGIPVAAISLVAPQSRMGPTRRAVLGERMRALAGDLMLQAMDQSVAT